MSNYLRIAIGVILGGAAGFIYYSFWGCKNGCALQSNWLIMTAYGAVAGLVLAIPSKKKDKKNGEQS